MFTGLIETIGTISSISRGNKSLSLRILPAKDDYPVTIGGSVAIDGACLTVESVSGKELSFTAVYETLYRTTLINKRVGEKVNLERAIRVGDRLEGHIVLGHVDGVGKIVSDQKNGDSLARTVLIPEEFRKYMASKGSVAIDGISLTIAESKNDAIIVSFIPHTLSETTMALKRVGDEVNIECDIFARYIAHQLYFKRSDDGPEHKSDKKSPGILTILESNGF